VPSAILLTRYWGAPWAFGTLIQGGDVPIEAKSYKVNERIRAKEVRVIAADGEQLGIMSVPDARKAAEDVGLDLIEVAPNAQPPVCRIMDYGKFRYEQRKKSKEAQKKSKQTEIKMVRLRPNTDDHDINFKMRNARKFLERGHKVRFTVIFRGPELRHKEIGDRQLRIFIDGCQDIANVEQPPRMEGRRMTMGLDPKPEIIRARDEARKNELAAAGGKRGDEDLEDELLEDDDLEDEDVEDEALDDDDEVAGEE